MRYFATHLYPQLANHVASGDENAGTTFLLTSVRFDWTFRGPGYFETDMGLTKSWKVHERGSLKFAWELFNVTNSVRLDVNTSTSLDNGIADGPAFGLFRKTLTAPRVQQFSMRLSF